MEEKAPAVQIDPGQISGVVFDMDGVVTDTATAHFVAWKRLFEDYLRGRRAAEVTGTFTEDDYRTYVDGRRREDGVAAFLAAQGIEIPWGEETDGPDRQTVVGLGRRKNLRFLQVVRTEGVRAFPSTIALVHALRRAGVGAALVTASRNARPVLEAAGVVDEFPEVVDGNVAAALGLPGKPDPALFVEAARRLAVPVDQAAVVEDALAGVEAGRRGHFALVIGVDRTGQSRALRQAGADAVVSDLAEVVVLEKAAL